MSTSLPYAPPPEFNFSIQQELEYGGGLNVWCRKCWMFVDPKRHCESILSSCTRCGRCISLDHSSVTEQRLAASRTLPFVCDICRLGGR